MGFHLLILCIILSSAMHSTWPNQFSLYFKLIFSISSYPTFEHETDYYILRRKIDICWNYYGRIKQFQACKAR
jgi:hypothetical protein